MNNTHWRHRAPRWMKVAAILISYRIWKAHHWLNEHSFLGSLHLFLEWFGGYEESMRQFDLRDDERRGHARENVDPESTLVEVLDIRLNCPACGHLFLLSKDADELDPETPLQRQQREIVEAIQKGDEEAFDRLVSRKPAAKPREGKSQ